MSVFSVPLDFNPRTLQESATCCRRDVWSYIVISIHAPYKRVRLVANDLGNFTVDISIHAPYKRVRLYIEGQRQLNSIISIHAPYKRVRPGSGYIFSISFLFQSTHPTRECDCQYPRTKRNHLRFQSTHPTRECDNFTM